MKLFIDTSAILAILNSDDLFHHQAKKEWFRIIDSKETLFSSNYIIVETIVLIQRRFGTDAVKRFAENLEPLINLVWIDENIHHSAMTVLKTINHRSLSLIDCTSFQIMWNLNIEQVFTFDKHFYEQGFKVIPKSE